MKLEQSFEVAAPLEQVWAALIDVRARGAVPARRRDHRAGTTTATTPARFPVKLGPTTASYRGTLRMEAVGRGAPRRRDARSGTDKRGQGGAKATIVNTLTASRAAPRR